jgi:DNA modification methylase
LEISGYRQDGGRVQIDGFHGSSKTNLGEKPYRNLCGKCGARRIDSQLGLEPTPEEYIVKMVAVFREVWRVLRDDGTLWLNMGDSYAANGPGGDRIAGLNRMHFGVSYGKQHDAEKDKIERQKGRKPPVGLKPKDLVGIPWHLAFALQADGWYLRSDIIWHKPNPMPESVTDRPTKAHEYIFLLTKSERYFYDNLAIAERAEYADEHLRKATSWGHKKQFTNKANVEDYREIGNNNVLTELPNGQHGRNKRSVWTIPTQPYAEAHFATFPEEIPKLCILAGTKPGDIVLDLFMGSGTTLQVALGLGRRGIGIELNAGYIELARERTNVTLGMF